MDSYVANGDEYPIVAAYGDYEVAKALVERLIVFGNPIGGILELEDYEMSHYDKEFVVYLTEDGVTCEKIYHDGVYYRGGGDISFVHEDCNSKLLSYIDSEVIYEFGIGECDEDDEDCDCCDCNNELAIDSDGDMHGFSVNRSDENGYSSFSFYSSEELTKEDVSELLKRFGF